MKGGRCLIFFSFNFQSAVKFHLLPSLSVIKRMRSHPDEKAALYLQHALGTLVWINELWKNQKANFALRDGISPQMLLYSVCSLTPPPWGFQMRSLQMEVQINPHSCPIWSFLFGPVIKGVWVYPCPSVSHLKIKTSYMGSTSHWSITYGWYTTPQH